MASIDKLPSGRFRVRWRGPDRRQQSRSFAAKADANAFRRQVDAELDAGFAISSADRRLTLAQYVTRPGGWLECRPWRPSSRELFASYWRAHLEPRWGDVSIAAIRPTDVQGWVNELARSLAPNTVKAIYRRLVSILRSAHSDGVIARQSVSGIRLPERANAEGVHVPTTEQVEALALAVPDRYETLVWTIATLGLRPAEAVGLTVERVDFLRKAVTIDRQLITLTGHPPQLAPLKTRRLPSRELPAPDDLVERLARHLERHPSVEVEVPEQVGGGIAHLVFSNGAGQPIRRGGLSYTWGRAATKARLPAQLRGWHSLRHYGIIRLIVGGVNPDYVRRFAGHTTLTETLNVYSGFWPSDIDDARDVLAAALESQTSHRTQSESTVMGPT